VNLFEKAAARAATDTRERQELVGIPDVVCLYRHVLPQMRPDKHVHRRTVLGLVVRDGEAISRDHRGWITRQRRDAAKQAEEVTDLLRGYYTRCRQQDDRDQHDATDTGPHVAISLTSARIPRRFADVGRACLALTGSGRW